MGSFLVSCFGQQNVIEVILGFPGGSVVKNPPAKAGDSGDAGLIPGVKKLPWRRKWQPTPVFLPEESHGQRILVGYSPQGHKEQYTTKELSMHTHLPKA